MEKVLKRIRGFKFAARSSAVKSAGKPDLALIFSDLPARCAAVFTTNRVKAAPLVVSAPRIRKGLCQAVLINSGNANACTGEAGLKDALRCSELAAQALGISEELVAVSSTGIIGRPMPMEKLERHIPLLIPMLQPGQAKGVAEAILTTDAFIKMAAESEEGEGGYRILGIAKGAGMIHPNMATMLAYILTDACVDGAFLNDALRQAVNRSFNCITVDGDTSTNDTVLLLANGLAENPEIKKEAAAAGFVEKLTKVCLELAKMIVRDGEGATKLVRIQVDGAESEAVARTVAKSVATSNLLKAAFFGADPNWGRVIAAVGYSGAAIDPNRVNIRFDQVLLVENGQGTGSEAKDQAHQVMKQPEFTVTVDLRMGSGSAFYYTSDLTYDYVRINADYHT
ncbi:MAG: bifunctional glutamate N-acetyltransferase/amino-acid acetyltransferase ArgJ [Desulfuromonadaceae bacterium]|nr:bifunctional glutamate N-acetyltransferase/amino-acid acetyltransferase ArgJ [Desulfuromonadaceae bacterium]